MRLCARLNCVSLCILYIFCVVCSLDVLSKCRRSCVTEWIVADRFLDVVCNETCKIEECYNGCKKWKSSINSSCQEVCNATDSLSKPQGAHYLFCTLGCKFGISAYINLLKDEIGTPPAPYLVAGSGTNDSVTIQWEPAKYENITYLVQYRNNDSHNKDWEYYDFQNPLSDKTLRIKGLHPFTNYRFRVAWILLPQYPPQISEESFVISTTPYGVPTSAPKITSLKAVSPTQVSIIWCRPLYPNGKIFSYALSLRGHLESNTVQIQYKNVTFKLQDVLDQQGQLYYKFSGLKPQTTYIVSIAARNAFGVGPASIRNITTPAKVESTKFRDSKPYLLFATPHVVGKLTLDITDEAIKIYESSESSVSITGVAFHLKENKVFLSDSMGSIHVVPAFGKERVMQPIIHLNSSYPSLLSVDWLNNKLYMVENRQIGRCGLDGNFYKVVVKELHKQPSHFHVDPYHGYLFWVFNDEEGGTLYRLDLDDIESKTLHQKEAKLIESSHEMKTFTIDYTNSQILYPDTQKNTVFSVSLDGSERNDIRTCSKSPHFLNVKGLTTYYNLFFWTNGTAVYGEEYSPKDSCYYTKRFMEEGSFIALKMMHADSQPYPVPCNPVESLQALFQDKMAKLFWIKPKRLEGVGRGAWQHWLYEVHLYDHAKDLTIFGNNISANFYKIFTLTPNTTYSIKVRPCSPDGKGEWSESFTGKTLVQMKTVHQPYIIWGTERGIVKSDIVGDKIKSLLHATSFNGASLTGIRWYQDHLFMNTNTSSVYVYQLSKPHSLRRLETVSNAGAIALDWLAPKLYWSSRVQQMIYRANLDGSQQESFFIEGLAQQLVINSLSGHLYWSTVNSVMGSYLDGSHKHKYIEIDSYSGKHIKGLALDFDRQKLYWMVRSHEGAFIYSSPLLASTSRKQFNNTVEFLGPLLEDNMQGPLTYFSDRLFWIHETKGAAVSDMHGRNIASYTEPQLNNLKHFVVVHPSLQPYPAEGIHKVIVVPDPIEEINITVQGSWNNFSIVWPAVTNVNYGEVFYDINLISAEINHSEVSKEPRLIFPKTNIRPYMEFSIGVRAFTVWAVSKQTVATLFSPMSPPSQPERPRTFISHKPIPSSSQEIDVEFRWSAPLYSNGVILGYRINCWYSEGGKNVTVCENIKVGGSVMKHLLKNLNPNCIYNFQVQAYNAAGEGPYTSLVKNITSHEQPVPKLLLAKKDAVEVADLDAEEEHLLSNKAMEPVAITYLARENKVFWLEKKGALMTSQTDDYKTYLIHTLSSEGTSLTIDWIGRYLYWTESESDKSSIRMFDLNTNHDYHLISVQAAVITAIEVEPFSSMLIWTEIQGNGEGYLKTSNSKGENVHFFFPSCNKNQKLNQPYKNTCSCAPCQLVGEVIALDRSNVSHPEVLWVDGRYGHIWASDLKGCKCRIIVNASENKEHGLPPVSITADTTTVYWSNADFDGIYSIEKELKPQVSLKDVSSQSEKPPSAPHRRLQGIRQIRRVQGIRQICAIGDNLQSYPDESCLHPSSNGALSLINKTSSSLKLQLPTVSSPEDCSNISMPTTQYSVYYRKGNSINMTECRSNTNHCNMKIVYSNSSGHNEISISELQPFTWYAIQVAVSNYYKRGNITPGQINVFRTREGVPYAPTNVSVVPVTPERLDVHWSRPSVLNGETVSYVVRWEMAKSGSDLQSRPYKSNNHSENRFTMALENLSAETKYYIVVSANSSEEKHNDSQKVSAVTYSLPNNLELDGVNAKCLNLSWLSPPSGMILHHMLEICELHDCDSEWQRVAGGETSNGTKYNFTIIDLKPKTTYKTRLVLTYTEDEVTFIWPKTFMFQTLGDSPDTPGVPHVRNIGKGNYQVVWTDAFSNGGDVTYCLEYRISETSNASTEDWRIIYNGSNTHWLVEALPPNSNYQFRVQAVNEYGKSDYSNTSEPFTLLSSVALASQVNEEVTIILITTLSALLFLASFLGIISYKMYKKHQKEKQIPHTVEQEHQNPDTELATLRELPLNGNFVHQNNALYSIGDIPTDEELATLPHIHREQIYVTKFLGSGAFGEVFEGIAHNLYQENEPPIKVAIKTLRKGATDQEKAEFLKEAKLMSNFKHDHILQLLGVCLNNNPNFIILELMEGGDLLTYLRSNRPSTLSANPLTMDDLIAICVDVAKGCHCLEEMHFVHRDLAARNCLVSSHDRSTRVVKIGDFGLARDIYKNDYYRKEGEGLLPVRWMAPESLVDGVFTSQSDVWAFGVLLWEVMTLGQQPYPARTNLEVLHYVRTGGKLEKPQNCPDDLHQLMNRCWSYCPEGRPTFEYCLETLKELRRKSSNIAHVNSVHNHNYLGHFHNGGIENLAYLEDEQQHDSGNRCRNGERDLDNWSTCSDPLQACRDVGNVNRVKRASSVNHPPLQKLHLDNSFPDNNEELFWQVNLQSPKYLEILSDSEDVTDADGYEMPLPPLPSNRRNRQMKKPLQYAELARLKSPSPSPSTRTDGTVLHHAADTDLLNLSYAPICPKLILDYTDNKENIDSGNGIDRFYESGSECLNSPIITSALLKPKSSQNLNVSEQKLNSSGQDMDKWSVSTVSTVPCPNDVTSDFDSFNHSGISSLSEVSGVELNYVPNSSWC